MKRFASMIVFLLALKSSFPQPAAAFVNPNAPCNFISAEQWGSVVGSPVKATQGEGNCTYSGEASGGQFRIWLVAGSASEAAAALQKFRAHPIRGGHAAVFDSQGTIVFGITLFGEKANTKTGEQLQKLVAIAKQTLAK